MGSSFQIHHPLKVTLAHLDFGHIENLAMGFSAMSSLGKMLNTIAEITLGANLLLSMTMSTTQWSSQEQVAEKFGLEYIRYAQHDSAAVYKLFAIIAWV
jgi:hypothetical protein